MKTFRQLFLRIFVVSLPFFFSMQSLALAAAAPTVASSNATYIGTTYVKLNGYLSSVGSDNPIVKFYYGPTDGASNKASWASSLSKGTYSAIGTIDNFVYNLTPGSTNYFQAYASNSVGEAWGSTLSWVNLSSGGGTAPTSLASSISCDTNGILTGPTNFVLALRMVAQPADPSTNQIRIWLSNGTGYGDAGDVVWVINDAGTIRSNILVDTTP